MTNGPNFFWPLMNFAGIAAEMWLLGVQNLYRGTLIKIKTRSDLLSTIPPSHRMFIRKDTIEAEDMAKWGIAVKQAVRQTTLDLPRPQ